MNFAKTLFGSRRISKYTCVHTSRDTRTNIMYVSHIDKSMLCEINLRSRAKLINRFVRERQIDRCECDKSWLNDSSRVLYKPIFQCSVWNTH